MTKQFCKVCSDFKDWLRGETPVVKEEQLIFKGSCPLDRSDLGRATWSLLHTSACYYPDNPNSKEQASMKSFIQSLIDIYPCEDCRFDFKNEIDKSPINVSSREALSQWLCDQHNIVNRKLSKDEFDCSLLMQRWKDGWKDGSCN